MPRLSTAFSEKLGLRLPLIAAPMAGGPTSPELVAACSTAGALGSFGFAYTQPEEMKKQVAAVRAKTDKPIGINLFVSPQPAPVAPEAQRGVLEAVSGYFKELGMPPPEPVKPPYAPDLEAQLATVLEMRPRVFTVHLGLLKREKIKIFKDANILVGGSATCAEEA